MSGEPLVEPDAEQLNTDTAMGKTSEDDDDDRNDCFSRHHGDSKGVEPRDERYEQNSSTPSASDLPQLRAYANNGSGNSYVALINIAMHHHHPSWLPTVVIPRHPDRAPVNQFRITLSTG
jgi:hypothetical protein